MGKHPTVFEVQKSTFLKFQADIPNRYISTERFFPFSKHHESKSSKLNFHPTTIFFVWGGKFPFTFTKADVPKKNNLQITILQVVVQKKISEKTCEMGWFLRCFLTMSRFLPGWFIPCFEIRSTSWWARPLCFWTSRAMRYLSIWMQLAERAYNDWPISTLIKLRAIYNLQWDRRMYVWVWWVSQVYNQKPWGILQVWVPFRAPSLLLSFEFLANLQAVKDLVVNLPRYLRSEATPHSRIVAGLS